MITKLYKLFDKLMYSLQPTEVLDSLLTITYTQFCPKPYEEDKHKKAMEIFSDKDKPIINSWIKELVLEYQKGIEDKNWCDPLGELYMEISSQRKCQGLGQFFSPESVCDLMTKINPITYRKGMSVNDPACGSGRMLLSFNAVHPFCYFYAEDIDSICAKMTVTNFAFHGMLGEVICHDTLTEPNGLRFGWSIKNIGYSVPAIIPITKEESIICNRKKETEQLKLFCEEENKQLWLM